MSLFWLTQNWTERVTKGVKNIDADHAYIHEGAAFEVSDSRGSTTAGAASARKYSFEPLVGSTATTVAYDSDKYVHLRPSHVAIEKGTMTFSVWEGSTKLSTGTTVTSYNRSRVSSAVSEFTVKVGDGSSAPTSTGSYKKIHEHKIWGGTGPGNTQIGQQAGQPIEWILKRNTKYVVVVNTTDAYSLNLFWYEEDKG